MTIRIDSVTVNGLGPIASIKWQFKDINLIYGKNEKGKTYLVEYLLSSLFKNVKYTRQLTDSGQVHVTGLDIDTSIFNPKAKKKLEDYLFAGDEKPVDLSRLCVVKGGELSFLSGGEEPLTKTVLKDYLSDQRILDAIEKGISTTIKGSSWENGIIVAGKQMGEIKTLNEYLQKIKQIDSLLKEVDQEYSLGEVKKQKEELEKVDQRITEQDLARRLYAYDLSQQILEKERELAQTPAEDLEKARDLVGKIEGNNVLIQKNQKVISDLEPKYEHYDWLRTAIEECEKRPEAFAGKLIWVLIALAMVSTIATIVFAFVDMPYYSLGAGLLAIISIILVIIQYRSRLRSSADRAEVESIFQEYEKRFGSIARSIATLKNKWQELSQASGELKLLKTQLIEFESNVSGYKKDIKSKLEDLVGRKIKLSESETLIDGLLQKRNQTVTIINNLKRLQASLNVQPEEYVVEPVGVKYDSLKLKELNQRKQALENNIREKEEKLNELKSKLIFLTHDPITIEWDELIDHLLDLRDSSVKESKQVKTQIGSGILISKVINGIRQLEDDRISIALASQGIREPIQALTHAYDGIDIEGNEIFVYNKAQRFRLSGLSTGTQEQILLALRIGIASQTLKDQKMFMILDDAFQHSDWDRREWLVDEMATLAKIGWQIIYFSMDNHIKSLFEDRIKPIFKDRYQTFELDG